jgi:hypothetical protein
MVGNAPTLNGFGIRQAASAHPHKLLKKNHRGPMEAVVSQLLAIAESLCARRRLVPIKRIIETRLVLQT